MPKNTLPEPVEVERSLKRMNAGANPNNGGCARGELRKRLANCSFEWFIKLFEALHQKKLPQGNILIFEFVDSFVRENLSEKLVELMRTLIILAEAPSEKIGCERWQLGVFMMWCVKCQKLTTQLLHQASINPRMAADLKLLLFRCLCNGDLLLLRTTRNEQIDFVRFTEEGKPVASDDPRGYYWTVSEKQISFALELAEEVRNHFLVEHELVQERGHVIPDWSVVDKLWSKIRTEAEYCLHDTGDEISFDLPELRTIRLTGVTIRSNGPFPNAEVRLHSDSLGVKISYDFQLKNGIIVDPEFDQFKPYFRWLITTAILAGYHSIVRGVEVEDQIHMTISANGNGNGKSTRNLPPGHTFWLRSGFKARPEAIAKCVYMLGRPPAPGKSFRVYTGKDYTGVQSSRLVVPVTQEMIAAAINGD